MIAFLLRARFVFLGASAALVSLYVWIGYRLHHRE